MKNWEIVLEKLYFSIRNCCKLENLSCSSQVRSIWSKKRGGKWRDHTKGKKRDTAIFCMGQCSQKLKLYLEVAVDYPGWRSGEKNMQHEVMEVEII